MNYAALVGPAVIRATKAFETIFDSEGRPYILHCLGVLNRLRERDHKDFVGMIVGVLHDIVEDTPVTLEEIRLEFGDRVADAVDGVTIRVAQGEKLESESYLLRVLGNPISTRVKIADIRDNLERPGIPPAVERHYRGILPRLQSSDSADGSRFRDAVNWALELHARQVRKGTKIPYSAHLLAVAALVLEAGGTETEAIAAVLHDAVEDTGATVEEMRRRFGSDVAGIVDACTDAYEQPKPKWRKRKEDYIAHLKSAPESVLLVALADKYHNANAILADFRVIGEELWERFNAGKEDQLWYYDNVARTLKDRSEGHSSGTAERLKHLAGELDKSVNTLCDEAGYQRGSGTFGER